MAKNKKESKEPRTVTNRRATYDYAVVDEVEAGIALLGSEVKSLYLGKANLTDAYVRIVNDEAWLLNADIEPYDKASVGAHERRRDRKLLLHRKEIATLERKALEKGFTLIPLRIYFNDRGRAKVRVALGRGKAEYDKRRSIADKETRREVERARALR